MAGQDKDTRLGAYRAKRDFARTDEPADTTPVAPAARPRFVVQKHDATRTHYDLRLEINGVFKSWAVTRGPSADPAAKRLAVETEDHPLAYGDFEGTIPPGQYGGGTVLLWDRGTWEPQGTTAEAGLAAGDLKFVLDGERMRGSWVLVRMKRDRSGGRRINWLLIKHRDEFAQPGADLAGADDPSIASGRTMAEVAAGQGRAPRPFMAAPGRVRRRKGSAPPDFVPPQLATLVERPPAGEGWVHEIKFDGYRTQLRVEAGRAALRTRTGLDWTARFPAVADAAAVLPDCLLDGEATVLDDGRRPDFGALQQALAEGRSDRVVFFAFDALHAGGRDLRPEPLAARKATLATLLKGAPAAIRFAEHFSGGGTGGGDAVLRSARGIGLEGIVSKRADAPYTSGRSEAWLKSKCRAGHEVVVGGWTTTGAKFRSLLVGAHREGGLAYLGRVGIGFGAAALAGLLPALKRAERPTSPFTGRAAPRTRQGVHWTEPVLVAEIEFAGYGAEGLVRQAAFKGLRDDKPPATVTPETPKTFTHPAKALWPQAGTDGAPVTKLDLLHYLDSVGPRLLEHVAGRPCSLLRCPDGIEGAGRFFQRHPMPGQSDAIEPMPVAGDPKPYLRLDRPEALAAAAQAAALELHPCNNRPGDPDVPGRLVFDLDPGPDVPFDAVIAAAITLRGCLEALGLHPFCKTTGGKGLHVTVPLLDTDPVDWPAAKAFAHDVCAVVAGAAPSLYLLNMSRTLRAGRIYLDYLRNDRLATAVAPFSPRARPGAPVSMPLPWSAIRRGLDPAAFTVRTVPLLLRRSRAWSGYAEAARPLGDAIRALARVR